MNKSIKYKIKELVKWAEAKKGLSNDIRVTQYWTGYLQGIKDLRCLLIDVVE